MYTSVWSVYLELCAHPLHSIPEYSITPKETCPHQQSPSLSPQPLITTDSLFVPVDLPVLEIARKWNHTVSPFVSGVSH